MGINALQVAWLSRLAQKNLIKFGDSIVEFGPQDIFCSQEAIRICGQKHCDISKLSTVIDQMFDGEICRNVVPSAFYSIFGVTKYRSVDLSDPRADWIRDCNFTFSLPYHFDIVTNFGTAEHVFNIAAVFHSMHDIVRAGGIMLHILPTFGDINHGFYNVHPTAYFDLAEANNYTIEDFCYVDRWDIRNKIFEENLSVGFDFDALPIQRQHLRDRGKLQRIVTEQFVANYNHADTKKYGSGYDSIFYDYCLVALRKIGHRSFRYAQQNIYGINRPSSGESGRVRANARTAVKRYIFPLIPAILRKRLVNLLKRIVARDSLDVK